MKDKTFEESLHELESIVHELETGNVELDKAIEKYTEAMKLAKICSDKITNATESVNKILNDDNKLEEFKAE
jgi:exodeoxyribonuclease VII small subunit